MQKTKLTPEDAFGRVLRERRLALGLTQADLESEGGLERSYISRLESGRYQVCLRGILSLARALQMTPAELMRDVELRLQGKEPPEQKVPVSFGSDGSSVAVDGHASSDGSAKKKKR